ncbi:MAG: hypothetical protein A3F18_07710 [Legionellales bacterium RIFCSPHIGHO2_12_FULL_37_14]|nr:MAG: hypothetical protein A3F18_07710 [Legionellales bacterium RIFCSPHIGHO2_12_FULL_37_14]
MHTLIICLFIACLLPFLSKLPVAFAMKNMQGGYDNNHPRDQQAKLTGFGARALAAHKNEFEALTVFAAAIVTSLALKQYSPTTQNLAILYLLSRVIYQFTYLINWGSFRTLVWLIGTLSSLGILWLCII